MEAIQSELPTDISTTINKSVEDSNLVLVKWKVLQVIDTIIKASIPGVKISNLCLLKNPWEESELTSEVVGFYNEASILSPIGDLGAYHQLKKLYRLGRYIWFHLETVCLSGY